METPTLCVKLPIDLATALRARAAAESLSVSEVLRSIIEQWLMGTQPSTDQGYIQARRYATMLAQQALQTALQNIPQTYDQAVSLFGIR